METDRILAELRAERDRINQAIAAIEGLSGAGNHVVRSGRPRTTTQAAPAQRRGRRGMSAAGRKRLSDMMKQRWESRKAAAKKTGTTRHMSAATRKRLSELAKQRWAERKKKSKAA